MTATLNGTFNSAPDTPSVVYPDRLIRPLPKRTLRSRLSIDAADTIHYPPTPPASQIFYGVSGDSEEAVNDSKVYVQQTIESDRQELTPEAESHHAFETAAELESGDEDAPVVVRRSAGFRGSLSPVSSTHPGSGKDGVSKSSTGPDGYDAFENTNNKKKRKIPTPGNMPGHHSALSPEFANMGLANSNSAPPPAGDGTGTGTYYGNGNPASPLGSGISGSGRGRLSGRVCPRIGQGRNPLSANAQNAWMNTRTPSRRDGLMSSPGPSGDSSDQGIISTAIANAASLSSPTRGPSNVSLLEQENTTPTKTQFTFTCESDSSKGMAMQSYSVPHRSPTSPLAVTTGNSRGFSTQGTQTSPNLNDQIPPGSHAPVSDQSPVTRQKKRSPSAVFASASRQRKIQQQYTNIHHPPSLEDIWICEFCEYESIFGRPPEALIRQYEIKDRKERKRLAEKKRLLEKAKMKGRKTKKTSKNASKNASGHHSYDRASVDHSSATGSGPHDDDYVGHEYDEEPELPTPNPESPTDLKPPLPPDNHPKLSASGGTVKGTADAGTMRPP
ncbi:hypothetical protein N7466_000392 [Penicillium verhagenii]|uniref:uncharacterized protein n=1 Tax=Penicillium verhagenii TaxID=1562060 RepID=UPI00254586CA|nr:uncharacterized protein N7466_000392 [Penicillium verhagenii]KAJ5947377.1 hypothetical protein N7466_000392 [Penicillium verhagenii]